VEIEVTVFLLQEEDQEKTMIEDLKSPTWT